MPYEQVLFNMVLFFASQKEKEEIFGDLLEFWHHLKTKKRSRLYNVLVFTIHMMSIIIIQLKLLFSSDEEKEVDQ